MPSPILTFSFILATMLGSGFHVVLGGDVRRLATFLLGGWLGFALGHLAGVLLEFEILNIGALRLLPALFGAVITLIFVQALTARRPRRRRR